METTFDEFMLRCTDVPERRRIEEYFRRHPECDEVADAFGRHWCREPFGPIVTRSDIIHWTLEQDGDLGASALTECLDRAIAEWEQTRG